MTTLLAVWLALFGLVQFHGRATRTKQALALRTGYDQCVSTIKNIAADGRTLFAMWISGGEQEIVLRSDDPVRWPKRQGLLAGESGARPLEAVIFSDFSCPSCKRLARFLDEDVQPLFDGRLKLVFKHYPLNRACNPVSTTQLHRYACDGAAMVEAARVLGGGEAFWKAHDFVFARQNRLKQGKLRAVDVAAELGLDAKRFADAANSDGVRERIGADATAGRGYGVIATPTLFVSGRQVRVPARDDIRFWDKLADHYWQGKKQTRPLSTMLERQAEPVRATAP